MKFRVIVFRFWEMMRFGWVEVVFRVMGVVGR